jgi:sulfate permease, SulP family
MSCSLLLTLSMIIFIDASVIGGYLSYIGWFCGVAGIGLMAGSSNVTPSVVIDKFVYILPGVLGGVVVYLAVSKLRHMAALPVSIMLEIVLFYCVLWATGTSVQEATDNGWIRQMDPPPVWYRTWDYLQFDKVDWYALPDLMLTELGMVLVVALSSSLDVAAIELELNRPLNYNHELKVIGLSNILSGVTGGYTGSYIFSQSIFSLRAGVRSRVAGYVLAICQIAIIVLPVPILAYVPNFFFGSLLSMICIDLMFEWLWGVRKRLTPTEYAVCVATFGLIQVLNVEYGMLAGTGVYLTCKKMGLDVGVSKFSTILDDTDDLILEVEDKAGNDQDARRASYGSI